LNGAPAEGVGIIGDHAVDASRFNFGKRRFGLFEDDQFAVAAPCQCAQLYNRRLL
jgi:hypothetical protein